MKYDNIINNPLVSVTVLTYNSSRFVLETLESIKAQTYKNIELIISDDCSTDNSVEICKQWLENNKERFVETHLITHPVNTGIPANKNRALEKCRGEWIKGIAADDILKNDSIKSYVDFCLINPNVYIVESISQFFKGVNAVENFLHIQNLGEEMFFNDKTTANQQYQLLLRRNYIHAPTVFINKIVYDKIGLYDETYRYIEDHPFWLKITQSGIKFHFMNKITVLYRIHDNSVFASFSKKKLFNDFYLKRRAFDLKYIYPNISWLERVFKNIEYYRMRSIDVLGLNKNIFVCKVINFASSKISPIRTYNMFKIKKIEKQIK